MLWRGEITDAHGISFRNRREGGIGPSSENRVLPDYFPFSTSG